MDQYNQPNTLVHDTPPTVQNTAIVNNSPYQQFGQTYQPPQPTNYYTNTILDSLSGWMKFIGIYTIVVGAITCLGIITAAIGVPMILSGISLNKASKSLKEYRTVNSPHILTEVFNYLSKYFKTQGILAIVAIAISILYVVVLLLIIVMGAYNVMYNY